MNSFSRSLKINLEKNDNFQIISSHRTMVRKECFDLVNDYKNWLIQNNFNVIILKAEPGVEVICMIYAIIIAKKTMILIPPKEEISHFEKLIEDTQADLILTFDKTNELNFCFLEKVISLDFNAYKITREKRFNLLPGMVFSTSGSLSEPKLVFYDHDVIYNYLSWCQQEFPMDERDVFLMTTPLSFIASLRSVFLPLFSNTKLILPCLKSECRIATLVSIIENHGVSIISMVPSLLNMIMQHAKHQKCLGSLSKIRLMLLSGEPIFIDLLSEWASLIQNNVLVYNLYGATEYLVPLYSKIHLSSKEISNINFLKVRDGSVVNKHVQDLAFYSLSFSGAIARGYLNKNSNENNFSFNKNVLSFHSNDYFKFEGEYWLYQGREDRIIKFYGVMINLAAIEQKVVDAFFKIYQKDIRTACLFYQNRIVILLETANGFNVDDLKDEFQKSLTSDMPSLEWILTKHIPKTESGKIDYSHCHQQLLLMPGAWLEKFFSKFFIDGQINLEAKMIDLALSSIDYISLSELLLRNEGRYLDLSKVNARFKVKDLLSLDKIKYKEMKMHSSVRVSPLQKMFYSSVFKDKLKNDRLWYVYFYKLKKHIDIFKLMKAIQLTMQNNFMLSCNLVFERKNWYFKRVANDENILLPNQMLKSFIQPCLSTPINSERLVKIYIQKRGFSYYLIFAYHHLAIDAWSCANIRREIFQRYSEKYSPVWTSRQKEIDTLNKINSVPTETKNIDELSSLYQKINFDDYNSLRHVLKGKKKQNRSTFFVTKQSLIKYKHNYGLLEIPESSIFLLKLSYAIFDLARINKFYCYVSLSNRMQSVINIKNVIMNMVSSHLLFLEREEDPQVFSEKIKSTLELLFKYMDYDALNAFYKSEQPMELYRQALLQDYYVAYTYVSNISEENNNENEFIDWKHTQSHIFLGDKYCIFLRVFDLGKEFMVNIDTILPKHLHNKLISNFQKS